MSLGKKLAATIAKAEAEKIRAEDLADAKRREAMEKRRAARQALVDDIKETVIAKIPEGLIPSIRVTNYENQRWLRECQKGKAECIDIFERLQNWATENEIGLTFKEDHDGAGIESWITVKVIPIEPDVTPSPM